MDFLKIRKKARERAAVRDPEARERRPPRPAGAERSGSGEEAEAGPSPPHAITPPADPVVTDADVLEGELAARLQGPAAPEASFATWRPGEGPPPVAPGPERSGEREAVPFQPAATFVVAGMPRRTDPGTAGGDGGTRDPLDEFFYREDEEAPGVPSLGGTSASPAEAEDPDSVAREEYLTFVLGGEEYAVAIERVREVMKSPPITEVPRAPVHILGVVTVRGEVMAVLDPRRRLGLRGGAPDGQGRVVIVDAGDGPCGLHVDRVTNVVRLRPGTIEPCPQGLGGAHAECLAGIGREGDRLFTVLDLGALLRRAPADRAGEGERHAGR